MSMQILEEVIPLTIRQDMEFLEPMTKVAQKDYALRQTIDAARPRRFGRKCRICFTKANMKTKSSGWTFHHLEYLYGMLTHRHFNPEKPEFLFKGMDKSVYGKIDLRSLYRLEVIRQVKRVPDNFRFVCSPHHQSIEKLDQYNPDKAKRLWSLWKETKTKWKMK